MNPRSVKLFFRGSALEFAANDSFAEVFGSMKHKRTPISSKSWRAISNRLASAEALSTFLGEASGFYSWIGLDSGILRAGVDHVRSFPVFYGFSGDKVIVSDDAAFVARSVGAQVDTGIVDEFLACGLVTGAQTTYAGVFQIQAGEWIRVDLGTDVIGLRRHDFFRFHPSETNDRSGPANVSALSAILRSAIRELIDYAGGRQIVIPLSGGYDSRLIAGLLAKAKYPKLMTFTYGRTGNAESAVSRRVAHQFGIPWEFVEYNPRKMREISQTSGWSSFVSHAWSSASAPHIQDFVAIKELMEQGKIEPDAVLAPGHSGDFIAGSHIPKPAFEKEVFSSRELAFQLLQVHFSNHPRLLAGQTQRQKFVRRLSVSTLANFDGSRREFSACFEEWDWRERQSKYIVNSVRVYEHFGLDWWLPLWDRPLTEFFMGLPASVRKERVFLSAYVDRYFPIDIGTDRSARQGLVFAKFAEEMRTKAERSANKADPVFILFWIIGRAVSTIKLVLHPIPYLACFPRRWLVPRLLRGVTMVGLVSADTLRRQESAKSSSTKKAGP